jgi:hypothetical protein
MTGILATLERHGLIAATPVDLEGAFKAYSRRNADSSFMPHGIRRQKQSWMVTPLGVIVCQYVRDAVEDAEPRGSEEAGAKGSGS